MVKRSVLFSKQHLICPLYPAFLSFVESDFWADIRLEVNVSIISTSLESAVGLFADCILRDAKGCQGSNRAMLQGVLIDYPFGWVGAWCYLVDDWHKLSLPFHSVICLPAVRQHVPTSR